jgi:hypothetical protein
MIWLFYILLPHPQARESEDIFRCHATFSQTPFKMVTKPVLSYKGATSSNAHETRKGYIKFRNRVSLIINSYLIVYMSPGIDISRVFFLSNKLWSLSISYPRVRMSTSVVVVLIRIIISVLYSCLSKIRMLLFCFCYRFQRLSFIKYFSCL